MDGGSVREAVVGGKGELLQLSAAGMAHLRQRKGRAQGACMGQNPGGKALFRKEEGTRLARDVQVCMMSLRSSAARMAYR